MTPNKQPDPLQKEKVPPEEKLDQDAERDLDAGRINLARSLYDASKHIYYSEKSIKEAWKISKPFMKDHDQ